MISLFWERTLVLGKLTYIWHTCIFIMHEMYRSITTVFFYLLWMSKNCAILCPLWGWSGETTVLENKFSLFCCYVFT